MFQKILTYIIIIGLVKFVISKLQKKQEDDIIVKDDEFYMDYKNYAKVLKGIAILGFLLFFAVSFLPSDTKQSTVLIIATCFWGPFYILAIMIGAFYIKITKEAIIYSNYFGMVKTYPYTLINQAIINEYQNIELYVDNKKVITYNLLFGSDILLSNLKSSNVPIKEGKIESFEIEDSKTGKGVVIFSLVVFVFFTIFSIVVEYPLGFLFFGILTLMMIIPTISVYYNKYIIKNETIIYKRFLRKNKEIKFSDIKYFKLLRNDDSERIAIYSKEKLEMEIPTGCTNIHLLEQLIEEKKWKFEK